MGCVSSVFQFGSYLVQEGAEVNEEQKEDSTSEKDGVPVPSSPSQDTVVTTASSGGEKVEESPTKIEAPLAKEEEFNQQTSPVVEDAKEPKQESEAKTGDAEPPEPEVKELQRVNETKVEKEKTVDTSGVTTEKTVYTQVSESVTIQETKGPAVDPFASSQKTVFPPFTKSWHESKPQAAESQTSPSYVHSVKVTESSSSSPGSPVSVSSDVPAPEKTQTVHHVSENISSEPEKVEVSEKSEVIEVATDIAESLNDSHPEAEKPEALSSPLPSEEQETHVDQESPNKEAEAEVVYEEEVEVADDNERSDVEGAVVKIQAGIRGYLTRKALKESRKDGPLMQSETGVASVPAASKQDEVPAEEPLEQAIPDSPGNEFEEGDAAVKIQAMYRGYRTRKQLDEMTKEPCDAEVETLNTNAEKTESPVQENRRSPPDRSPVTVTENFVPILKAQITITPPSSPTMKQQHSLPSVEATPKDSNTSAVPETSEEISQPGLSDENENEENKKHAATKIQAAFRGYKVRKVSRKEAPGSVKGSSDAKESTDVNLSEENVPKDVIHEGSPQLMRDSPSPPLDQDNEEDTLEDSTADDVDEIPNVEWQTSGLYTDDSSPKQEGSKTETVTEEATAPVVDSPKSVSMSSEQVILSTAKITLESHGSPSPPAEEDQQIQSDH